MYIKIGKGYGRINSFYYYRKEKRTEIQYAVKAVVEKKRNRLIGNIFFIWNELKQIFNPAI